MHMVPPPAALPRTNSKSTASLLSSPAATWRARVSSDNISHVRYYPNQLLYICIRWLSAIVAARVRSGRKQWSRPFGNYDTESLYAKKRKMSFTDTEQERRFASNLQHARLMHKFCAEMKAKITIDRACGRGTEWVLWRRVLMLLYPSPRHAQFSFSVIRSELIAAILLTSNTSYFKVLPVQFLRPRLGHCGHSLWYCAHVCTWRQQHSDLTRNCFWWMCWSLIQGCKQDAAHFVWTSLWTCGEYIRIENRWSWKYHTN